MDMQINDLDFMRKNAEIMGCIFGIPRISAAAVNVVCRACYNSAMSPSSIDLGFQYFNERLDCFPQSIVNDIKSLLGQCRIAIRSENLRFINTNEEITVYTSLGSF